MEKHFDSVINNKLQTLAKAEDWLQMSGYLKGLSNSGFRTASYILAERILPQLSNDAYWQCFSKIATTNTKAYLMTFLKAGLLNYQKQQLSFLSPEFMSFACSTQKQEKSLDRQKSLLYILPHLRSFEEVKGVLDAFCGTMLHHKMKYMVLSAESKPCYYALFQLMRHNDVEVEIIIRNLKTVLQRSTPMAFNFVSIMRAYFDIEELNGQFSLRLEPYELSRIETNYDAFVAKLTSV